jgi:hypothetical protein
MIQGDFENYDGSTSRRILTEIVEVINDWYDDGEENKRIRRVLFQYITSAIWYVDGQFVWMDHTQPSGNFLTTIINCLHNMFLFRIAYMLCKRANNLTMECRSYTRNTSISNYGDDCAGSVSFEVSPWFNMITISKQLGKLGFVFTDANKKMPTRPTMPIEEVSYLKRGFKEQDGTTVAPLCVETIKSMVMWTHNKSTADIDECVSQTVECACVEAYAHGPEFANEFRDAVRARLLEHGKVDSTVSYEEAQACWLHQKIAGPKPVGHAHYKIRPFDATT